MYYIVNVSQMVLTGWYTGRLWASQSDRVMGLLGIEKETMALIRK